MMTHKRFLLFQLNLDRFRSPFGNDPDDGGTCRAQDPEPDDAYAGLDRQIEELSKPGDPPAPSPLFEPVPPSHPDLWKNTRWLNANAHRLTFRGQPVLEAWVVIHGEAVESCHETRALAHGHVKTQGWQGVAIIWRVTQTLIG